jgi:hypothetical protein
MKRPNVAKTVIAVVLALVPLMGAWCVWEGNAGIAAVAEFPGSGMYAKSDMFPRNTIVEIENLETGLRVRAVVTGSSAVPGLVAVLSPETASALRIKPGQVSRVRIRIPVPVGEKAARGTISSGSSAASRDPDINPAEASLSNRPKDPSVPLSSIVDPGVEPMVNASSVGAAAATTMAAAAETAGTEAAFTVSESPEIAATETPAETVTTEAATAESTVASGEAMVTADDIETAEETIPVPASGETAPLLTDSSVPVEGAETTDATAPDAVSPSAMEEAAIMASTPDEASSAEASEDLASTEPTADTPVAAYEDEPALAAGEETVTTVDLVPAEPNPPVAAPESALEGPSIVVVPELPPMERSPEDAGTVEYAPPLYAPEYTVTAPVEPALPVESAPPVAPAVVSEVAKPLERTMDLPIVSSLEKGAYYVQVATYRDADNARRFVGDWGKKYPVCMERGSSDSLKVCIGPVSKDEYGAILERFKGLGFKDAFLRKGK